MSKATGYSDSGNLDYPLIHVSLLSIVLFCSYRLAIYVVWCQANSSVELMPCYTATDRYIVLYPSQRRATHRELYCQYIQLVSLSQNPIIATSNRNINVILSTISIIRG